MSQWYAVHTKPRVERQVTMSLKQRGVESFLPETTVITTSQKRKKTPFFPGYLFMRVDLATDNPAMWQWTPGLRHIVAYGGWPVPIPDEVINLIEVKLHELESRSSKPAHPFKPGDVVRIKNGPFSDMLGIFDGPSTPSERVHVLMGSLNNSVRVRVSASALELAHGADKLAGNRRPRRSRGRGRRIN
ncbi:MAG TPA: transcription termination/antitermination NusG family protein [Anaerolineae bacterium]|nr:transcription termination/antitermination NusG family protein [Anaerolineae bacterium]